MLIKFAEGISTDFYQEMKTGTIFVGFISSSLYKSHIHGLNAIGLVTDLLSHNGNYKADMSFKSSEYKHIPD